MRRDKRTKIERRGQDSREFFFLKGYFVVFLSCVALSVLQCCVVLSSVVCHVVLCSIALCFLLSCVALCRVVLFVLRCVLSCVVSCVVFSRLILPCLFLPGLVFCIFLCLITHTHYPSSYVLFAYVTEPDFRTSPPSALARCTDKSFFWGLSCDDLVLWNDLSCLPRCIVYFCHPLLCRSFCLVLSCVFFVVFFCPVLIISCPNLVLIVLILS